MEWAGVSGNYEPVQVATDGVKASPVQTQIVSRRRTGVPEEHVVEQLPMRLWGAVTDMLGTSTRTGQRRMTPMYKSVEGFVSPDHRIFYINTSSFGLNGVTEGTLLNGTWMFYTSLVKTFKYLDYILVGGGGAGGMVSGGAGGGGGSGYLAKSFASGSIGIGRIIDNSVKTDYKALPKTSLHSTLLLNSGNSATVQVKIGDGGALGANPNVLQDGGESKIDYLTNTGHFAQIIAAGGTAANLTTGGAGYNGGGGAYRFDNYSNPQNVAGSGGSGDITNGGTNGANAVNSQNGIGSGGSGGGWTNGETSQVQVISPDAGRIVRTAGGGGGKGPGALMGDSATIGRTSGTNIDLNTMNTILNFTGSGGGGRGSGLTRGIGGSGFAVLIFYNITHPDPPTYYSGSTSDYCLVYNRADPQKIHLVPSYIFYENIAAYPWANNIAQSFTFSPALVNLFGNTRLIFDINKGNILLCKGFDLTIYNIQFNNLTITSSSKFSLGNAYRHSVYDP